MIHCGRTIAAEEGVKSLWKGLSPFVGQLTLKYALRMGSNAWRCRRAAICQQCLHQRCQRVGSGLANLPLVALHGLATQPQDACQGCCLEAGAQQGHARLHRQQHLPRRQRQGS